MKAMISALAIALSLCDAAEASCVCRCVNGQMVPLCSSAIEVPPICPPTVCGIVPPSVRPVPTPMVPPIGTTSCAPQQVMNPFTHQYEWRTVCR
jgi:hypothetical protein